MTGSYSPYTIPRLRRWQVIRSLLNGSRYLDPYPDCTMLPYWLSDTLTTTFEADIVLTARHTSADTDKGASLNRKECPSRIAPISLDGVFATTYGAGYFAISKLIG